MDNHPIPQDVTGFQFKLIGNMTVKQFAYLATGVVFGWVLLQLPVNILIKFPFAAFFAILGIGLAYFPISGRPMDLMIGNYIKALIRPTEFVYEKIGGQIYFPNKAPVAVMKNVRQYKNNLSPFPKDKLKAYLETMSNKPKNKVDEKEDNFLSSIYSLTKGNIQTNKQDLVHMNMSPVQTQTIPQPSLATYTSPQAIPQKQATNISQSILTAQPITLPSPNPEVTHQLIQPATPPPTIQTTLPQPTLQKAVPFEKFAPKKFARSSGVPCAPDSPNLITGVTKDPRGNPLSNILIEVKDKDGNPIRAFKTNELGRFASATPLPNGSYIIEFEDVRGQNKFERVAISTAGQIIQPIEAISVDAREELRRSLFAPSSKAVN